MAISQLKSVVYSLRFASGQFIVIAQPVLLLLLLTRVLSIDEYGRYAKSVMFAGFFLPIVAFNYTDWQMKELLGKTKGGESVVVNGLFLTLINSIIVLPFSLIWIDLELAVLSLSYAISIGLLSMGRTQMIIDNNRQGLFLLSLLQVVVNVVSIILIVFVLGFPNYELIILSLIATNILLFGVSFSVSKANHSVSINWSSITPSLKFLFPLVAFSAVALLSNSADRLFASQILSDKEFAVYQSSFQIAFVIGAVGNLLQVGWSRDVLEKKIDLLGNIRTVGTLIVIMILLSSAYRIILPNLIDVLLPEVYTYNMAVIDFFILGGFLQFIYFLLKPHFLVTNRANRLLLGVIVSSVITWTFLLFYFFQAEQYEVVSVAMAYPLGWLVLVSALLIAIVFGGRKK